MAEIAGLKKPIPTTLGYIEAKIRIDEYGDLQSNGSFAVVDQDGNAIARNLTGDNLVALFGAELAGQLKAALVNTVQSWAADNGGTAVLLIKPEPIDPPTIDLPTIDLDVVPE